MHRSETKTELYALAAFFAVVVLNAWAGLGIDVSELALLLLGTAGYGVQRTVLKRGRQ